MIVNTEVINGTNDMGIPCKLLVVSYIDSNGKIAFLKAPIPDSQLYKWRLCGRGMQPDPVYLSWDNKYVCREPIGKSMPDTRIHEFMVDLYKAYPSIGEIYNLNMPDTSFCDIEVEVNDDGFPKASEANNKITTVSWVHNSDAIVLGRAKLTEDDIKWIQGQIDEHCKDFKTKYKFTYVYFDNEEELIRTLFMDYIKPAPCVTGWNFFGYDWPYLFNRCYNLNIDISYLSETNNGSFKKVAKTDKDGKDYVDYNIPNGWFKYNPQKSTQSVIIPKHKLLYDYMEIYDKWDMTVQVKESNKLDWVSQTVVGAKKVEHQLGFAEMWKKEPVKYVFYNAIDSILVREIDNKIKTSTAFLGLANLMHVDALTAFSPVRSLEVVQTEYLYKENKIFPTKDKEASGSGNGVDESYEGAFVYEPIPGVYKNVIALDFASLYPTTMRQFNISPDTYIEKNPARIPSPTEIKCTSGAVYRKDFQGFIPKILTDFYTQRKAYKKEMMVAIDEKYALMEIYEKRFGPVPE